MLVLATSTERLFEQNLKHVNNVYHQALQLGPFSPASLHKRSQNANVTLQILLIFAYYVLDSKGVIYTNRKTFGTKFFINKQCVLPSFLVLLAYDTRNIITRSFYVSYSIFEVHLFAFKDFFFWKILCLCMSSIQERFLFKSGGL